MKVARTPSGNVGLVVEAAFMAQGEVVIHGWWATPTGGTFAMNEAPAAINDTCCIAEEEEAKPVAGISKAKFSNRDLEFARSALDLAAHSEGENRTTADSITWVASQSPEHGATSTRESVKIGNSRSASTSDNEESIKEVLDTWAKSFRSKDARIQADCYAPVVETYFRWHNVSKEQLLHDKEKAFAAMAEIRKFDVSDIHISFEQATEKSDSSIVYGRAVATLLKEWDTSTATGKPFSGKAIEKLTFTSSAEGWKIVGEEELKILQVTRQ
jgi:hypothetical protein